MKPRGRTWRVLWELHAWAGAVASVLLVLMFLLGSVALFHDELAPWIDPRLRGAATLPEAKVLATLQAALDARSRGGVVKRLDVDLPDAHAPMLRLSWEDAGGKRFSWIDPETGEEHAGRSDLGHFLFLMHFLYPLPGGMFVAGLCAVVLLLLAGTGLAIQLGRFRAELVRVRPAAALRTVWGDLHTVLGSLGLPFQAVIAWTAAIVCLNATVLQPTVVHTAFDGDRAAGLASIGYPQGPRATGRTATAPDVAAALRSARRALPDAEHVRLSVRLLGDESGHVDVRGRAQAGLHAFTTVRVDRGGGVLHVRDAGGPGLGGRVIEGAYVLHSGMFGGDAMRLAWALLGIFGALCIVTGNLVWLARRAGRHGRFDRLLARLTSGGSAGAAMALAVAFLANQLLPDGAPDRPVHEEWAFHAAWLGAMAFALWHGAPVRSSRLLMAWAGVLLVSVPVVDFSRHGATGWAAPAVATSAVVLVVTGLSFLATAAFIGRFEHKEDPSSDVVERGPGAVEA